MNFKIQTGDKQQRGIVQRLVERIDKAAELEGTGLRQALATIVQQVQIFQEIVEQTAEEGE